MKARKENTFGNNIVVNLFPHKVLKMAARLLVAVVKAAVGIIVGAGCFILSVVLDIVGGVLNFALGCLITLLSIVAFFGFILWLFTL